jgi:hypothetical protein
MKLPEPVPHQAFCTRGCYESFFLYRCLGCEKRIEKPANAWNKCKSAAQANKFAWSYVPSLDRSRLGKNPNKTGVQNSPQNGPTSLFANAPLNVLGRRGLALAKYPAA